MATRIRSFVDAQAAQAGGTDVRAVRAAARQRQRRRRAAASAAILTLVVVLGVGGLSLIGPSDGSSELVASGGSDSSQAPTDSATTSEAVGRTYPMAAAGQWRTVAAPPLEPRSGAVMAASDTQVLVWGGRNLVDGITLGDGALLDIESGQWTRIEGPSGSPGRIGASAIWDGQSFVIVGGWQPSSREKSESSVLSFDPTRRVWTIVADDPRAALTAPVLGISETSELLIVGGFAGQNGTPTSGSSALNLDSSEWTDLGSAPWPVVARDSRPGSGARDASPSQGGVASASMDVDGGTAALRLARLGMDGWSVGAAQTIGSSEVAGDPARVSPAAGGPNTLVTARLDRALAILLNADGNLAEEAELQASGCDEGDNTAAVAVGARWVLQNCDSWLALDANFTQATLPPPAVAVPSLVQAGSTLVAIDLGSPEENPNTAARGGAAATLTF